MNKRILSILAILLLLGGVAFYLVFNFVFNKAHPDYAVMKPEVVTTAIDVYNKYTTDKVYADKLYTGKLLEITGTLSNYETTDSNMVINFVFNEGMFGDEGVRCITVPGEIETVTENNQITVKGYCTGYNETDVILEKCTIKNQ